MVASVDGRCIEFNENTAFVKVQSRHLKGYGQLKSYKVRQISAIISNGLAKTDFPDRGI